MVNTLEIIGLLLLMGVTSIIAGTVPLVIKLSQNTLTLISLLSMGILVSTSLVIVIPEGMETIYDTSNEGSKENVGLILLLGFLSMYLLDNIGILSSDNEQSTVQNTSDERYYSVFHTSDERTTFKSILKSICSSSITIGLLIHALVDGISLGTSFMKMNSFHIIMFLSLIIHKIPTCFSLSTILIKENYSPNMIRYHLGLFALCTPISAIITYFLIRITSISQTSVGYLLLFSGGTFLYVVIHVMFDVAKGFTDNHENEALEEQTTGHKNLSNKELLISVIGMIIPVLIQLIGE